MKEVFLMLVLYLRISSSVIAAPAAVGSLRFSGTDGDIIELGKLESATRFELNLKLQNDTSESISVLKIKGDCSCLSFSQFAGRIIKPNSTLDISGMVSLPYSTVDQPQEKHIIVETNHGVIVRNLKFHIVPSVLVSQSNSSFGIVTEKSRLIIKIKPLAGRKPLSSNFVLMDSDDLEVESVIRSSDGVQVTVRPCNAALSRGSFFERIGRLVLADENAVPLPFEYSGEFVSEIEFLPKTLNLGFVEQRQVTTKAIVSCGKMGKNFKLIEVIPPDDTIAVKWHRLPSGEYELEFSLVLDGFTSEAFRKVIKLKTNDSGNSIAYYAIVGVMRSAAKPCCMQSSETTREAKQNKTSAENEN